jgi:hypothetical protein
MMVSPFTVQCLSVRVCREHSLRGGSRTRQKKQAAANADEVSPARLWRGAEEEDESAAAVTATISVEAVAVRPFYTICVLHLAPVRAKSRRFKISPHSFSNWQSTTQETDTVCNPNPIANLRAYGSPRRSSGRS